MITWSEKHLNMKGKGWHKGRYNLGSSIHYFKNEYVCQELTYW
jgi:hypothetical protein